MIRDALIIAGKDLRLVAGRSGGLVQALLLGLLLLFLFSLSREPGTVIGGQSAAAIFWLATLFAQVLIFNGLYALEESDGTRQALLLSPIAPQAVWLGKGLAGWALLLVVQAVFLPAAVVFLGQSVNGPIGLGLLVLAVTDWGLAASGSLIGALAQGKSSRESLLSIILFPLLIPLLLAAIRIGTAVFSGVTPDAPGSWLGTGLAFDAVFTGAGLILFPFMYTGED